MINPNLKINGYSLVRLTQDHTFLNFDCEDIDLNDFLKNDSKVFQDDLLGVTYILEDSESNETIAFFCLSNDKISAENFDSSNQWKKRVQDKFSRRKKLRDYPAIKIGRLAVSKEHKRKLIGKNLLEILKLIFISENRTGCRFVTVDAYAQSLEFYKKIGFVFFNDKDKNSDTRQMYFDLQVVLTQFSVEELSDMKKQILPQLIC